MGRNVGKWSENLHQETSLLMLGIEVTFFLTELSTVDMFS